LRPGIGCASGARIRPLRAVIIHARELTARGFTLEMEEWANRDSGAIQSAGDVALDRRMRGVSRLPAKSWWAGGYRPARLLTSNPSRRTAMPQDQPSHTPASAARPAVTRSAGVAIRPMGPGDAGQVLAVYQAGLDTGLASFETTAPSWEAFDAAKLPGHGSSPPMATGRCCAGWPFPRVRPGGYMPGSSSTASTSVAVIIAAGSARRSIGTVPASSASHARSGHVNRDEPLAPALGDSKLVPQHQDLGVPPPRQPQQRYCARDTQEDQLQAHKPKIIPSRVQPSSRRTG
jgi:hypothetical protein